MYTRKRATLITRLIITSLIAIIQSYGVFPAGKAIAETSYPSNPNMTWTAAGSDQAGLQLGIAGPDTVGFRPRSLARLKDGSSPFNSDDEFTVTARNIGPNIVHLCGVPPTFSIAATNAAGKDIETSSGLGSFSDSYGPKVYDRPIKSGSQWFPGAKVPLRVLDASAPSGVYTLKARMTAKICNPDQRSLKQITIYSGAMTVYLTR